MPMRASIQLFLRKPPLYMWRAAYERILMPGDKRVTLKSTFRRHGIRPLTLRFESKTEEAQYQNFVLESAIFHIRYANAFAAILTVIYVSLSAIVCR